MEGIFRRLPRVHRIVEDILVASETWEQHLEDVARVLQVATEHGVSFNAAKAQFGKTVVTFGGFVVTAGKFKIDEELTEALRQFPRPTNRTELRSFLGLVQQLSPFTDEVTELVEPLRALNKNNVAWRWTPDMEAAFDQARRTLAQG